MPNFHDVWRILAKESGATTILTASHDAHLLCLQRFIRLFAYGISFLILVHFLANLGINDARIGLFMTLTLLGDVVISFCLTLITDNVGRKKVLAAGAGLMAMSGVVFAMSENYWILVLASVIGVISPSGNEIGPFRAIEESILSQLTQKEDRSDVFAWYTLFGTLGAALGTLTCGFMVAALQKLEGWDVTKAYRVVFGLYAVLGVVKLFIILLLSPAVEVETSQQTYDTLPTELDDEGLLSDEADNNEPSSKTTRPTRNQRALPSPKRSLIQSVTSLVPTISPQSRTILIKLILLFTLDSFASGLASPSWLTYFFTTIHHLPSQALGTLFLTTNLLATVSNLLALPLARRLGPLKTMTFTHLPSAIFLALIPLPPANGAGTWTAMGFLALRACTQSMDQAPRQAFLAAAVLPEERTAVLGVVNIAKTLAQAGGIGCTGVLAGAGLWGLMFGGAGGLKASYDLLMLWMFLGMKDREGGRT